MADLTRGAAVLSRQPTRLGGELVHMRSPALGSVFVKMGRGQARVEILREHQTLSALSDCGFVPAVVAFDDDGSAALIGTRQVEGRALHTAVGDLGRAACVRVVSRALQDLWSVPRPVISTLPTGVVQEIDDVRRLLAAGLIDTEGLERAAGQPADDLLDSIATTLLGPCSEVLTHGDLCLPNIIVDPDARPVMIDWGKAGRGEHCRDMASLQFSLERNLDRGAFFDVAAAVGVDVAAGERRMQMYRLLDQFWYHAIG